MRVARQSIASRSGRAAAWVVVVLGLPAAVSIAVAGVLSAAGCGGLAAAEARVRQAGRPPLSGSEVFVTAVLGGALWESAALGGACLISRRLLDKRRARLRSAP